MNRNKRSLPRMSRVLLCVLVLPLASCNLFRKMQYDLSVTVESGVNGTPDSGVQTLDELTPVDYSYTPVNSLHTVEVMVDDSRQSANGTVTIYKDTTLDARLVDIRATWNVISTDANSVSSSFTITVSGPDVLGGTFTDSRGYTGTWTGPSNVVTITYGNWEAYKYTGTLFSMSGTYTNGSASGTWSATRAD
jgi:hypothetical protein